MFSSLLFYRNAHAASGAGDHAHRGFHGSGVEVGHLRLGDLADLFFRQGSNLRLVGGCGCGLDTASLLDKNGGGRSLRDEGEGTVGLDRDDDGNDQTDVILRSLVEFLREVGDGYTVLTEGGTYGRLGSSFSGGKL